MTILPKTGVKLDSRFDYYNEWDKAKATHDEKKGTLEICGLPVMERWQTEYMSALANVASKNKGRVLEIGFGLGLASNFIQNNDVDEHVIIEANTDIFRNLVDFKNSSSGKIVPICGKWQDACSLLAPRSFDGILYDAIPMNQTELHTRQFDFLKQASKLLKDDGVFTYCNVTSWGHLMAEYSDASELFEATQIPLLQELGFRNCSYEILDVIPGEGCKYQYHTLPVPEVRR